MGDWSREEGRSSDPGAASFLSGPTIAQRSQSRSQLLSGDPGPWSDKATCHLSLQPGTLLDGVSSGAALLSILRGVSLSQVRHQLI